MSKKKEPRPAAIPVSENETLLFPWPVSGVGFTEAQVLATAEHLLAIPSWVPIDRVISFVDELLELVSDELAVFEDDHGREVRLGDNKTAAPYALLAVRLIDAYQLVLSEAHAERAQS